MLVSLVTVALATMAGGRPEVVVTLGGGMLCFQASIGAANDLADRVEDGRRGAPKPIPGGQISVSAATLVAWVAGVAGLALSALVGPAVALVGAIGLMAGIAYDLWLRQRGLEVLAYALALPMLVVYAWWGAAGTLPPGGGAVLVLAALVGPSLYLANALVDVDADRQDGSAGMAARLGQRGSVLLLGLLVAVTHAIAWLVWMGTRQPVAATLAMGLGGMVAIAGVVLAAQPERSRRSLGWTAQAVGTALMGVGLLAALASDAGPRAAAAG